MHQGLQESAGGQYNRTSFVGYIASHPYACDTLPMFLLPPSSFLLPPFLLPLFYQQVFNYLLS
jgi:hypothetical protein